MADSLQVKTEKLIKYGNEKFNTNETTIRGIFDNASIGGTSSSVNDIIYYMDVYDAFTSTKYKIVSENYEDTNIQMMDNLLTQIAGD